MQPNEQKTLAPGIYCGGLTIKGGLTINSQAAVSGSGVTFYLTGSGAGFSINGWLAVLLTFILSRVFAEGAHMREDLEGTV